MKGERCASNLLVHLLLTLMVPDLIYSMSQPIFKSKRFGKAGPPAPAPAFVPIMFPAAQIPRGFEVPDYDDNYTPFEPIDENENYPLAPIYGYLRDQSDGESFIDYEEDGNGERDYPYGRETWYKGGEKDDNVAFLRNLILSEMDQDPEADSEIVYGTPVEYSPEYVDTERDRTWYYGVPVYAEKDRTRSRKDDSVRELESLTRQMKAEEARGLEYNNEDMVPMFGDEVLRSQWQKKMSRSGRKNSVPLREGFKTNEKRFYPAKKSGANAGARQNNHLKAKDSDRKNKTETTTTTTSAPQRKTTPNGQKEFVLPRPANPVRKPLQRGGYTGSTGKADVYETIKKLLAMEEGLQKDNRPRIQKRFVLSEDQLSSQLNGLKRISV